MHTLVRYIATCAKRLFTRAWAEEEGTRVVRILCIVLRDASFCVREHGEAGAGEAQTTRGEGDMGLVGERKTWKAREGGPGCPHRRPSG